MNATLTIDEPAFLNSIMAEFQKVKVPCQAAMAKEFHRIVIANFEESDGEDRPQTWDKLRYMYANEKHDGDRTPHLTLSGTLKNSIDIGDNLEDYASVFTFNPYAADHQNPDGFESEFEGKKYHIPGRPFFPIVDNEVIPYTAQKCVDACEAELVRSLK